MSTGLTSFPTLTFSLLTPTRPPSKFEMFYLIIIIIKYICANILSHLSLFIHTCVHSLLLGTGQTMSESIPIGD